MKLGYFMRGLGIGIILTVVTLSIAFNFSDNYKMSDEEIKQEAKKLGLVESTKPTSNSDNLIDKGETKEPTETDETKEPTKTEGPTETDETTEPTETKGPGETDEPIKNGNPTETEASYINITIKRGMHSQQVAKMLEDNKLIEDAYDFNKYLVENNFSKRISIGTKTIYKNSTYEEIAWLITR